MTTEPLLQRSLPGKHSAQARLPTCLDCSANQCWWPLQLTADQPWTTSVRHKKTAALLQAKMMSEDPELQHEVRLQHLNAAHIDCCLLLRVAG